MRPKFRLVTILLSALAVLAFPWAAYSQDVPLPSTEAAPTLFPFSLGDSQAQLQLSGSWSTDIGGSLGYSLSTLGGGLYPSTFPGMTEGFNFNQTPNIDISLRLLDRYFFKTSFVDTSGSQSSSLPLGLNTFLLGYDGKPNEFLQSVRVGNTDVNMGTYDFLSFPDPSTSSIGASANFASGNGSYEAMVRYEPANLHRRLFIGHSEITEQRVAPGTYVNGQYFVLPDNNVENVSVYIEDGTGTLLGGDNHLYRKAGPSDVIVSAADGTITFRKPLVGRALVYYTKSGTAVGSSSLGKSFLPAVKSGTTPPT
ncbi:MAG TPA: hypothetical protein VMW69_17160, partial [Spirochaetia bacterium]|nr:hypothetical protein [Spirochaetia bacterium]